MHRLISMTEGGIGREGKGEREGKAREGEEGEGRVREGMK